uniref:Uncharacterized protein n=1 Tax=Candidatus Methanophaga sp. ANME-1 ERB7 TaxID=2759913 RepID=A0A7G9Z2U8_9EURY|nr:hypothetical protein KENJCFKB_00043 [Methanosarcinales archaeon ANME-1 ERB7]
MLGAFSVNRSGRHHLMSGLNRAGLVSLLRGLVMVIDKEEKRVLLVEDEKGDALLVRKILGKKNGIGGFMSRKM